MLGEDMTLLGRSDAIVRIHDAPGFTARQPGWSGRVMRTIATGSPYPGPAAHSTATDCCIVQDLGSDNTDRRGDAGARVRRRGRRADHGVVARPARLGRAADRAG